MLTDAYPRYFLPTAEIVETQAEASEIRDFSREERRRSNAQQLVK